MLKLATDTQHIATYGHGDYFIDIIRVDGIYEAWLEKKGYAIKELMFGADTNIDTFLGLVESNLDEHIKWYYQQFSEEEE